MYIKSYIGVLRLKYVWVCASKTKCTYVWSGTTPILFSILLLPSHPNWLCVHYLFSPLLLTSIYFSPLFELGRENMGKRLIDYAWLQFHGRKEGSSFFCLQFRICFLPPKKWFRKKICPRKNQSGSSTASAWICFFLSSCGIETTSVSLCPFVEEKLDGKKKYLNIFEPKRYLTNLGKMFEEKKKSIFFSSCASFFFPISLMPILCPLTHPPTYPPKKMASHVCQTRMSTRRKFGGKKSCYFSAFFGEIGWWMRISKENPACKGGGGGGENSL